MAKSPRDYGSLLLKDLRTELKARNAKVTGRKYELVERYVRARATFRPTELHALLSENQSGDWSKHLTDHVEHACSITRVTYTRVCCSHLLVSALNIF